MEEQICPECGCEIEAEACEREGVVYCCEPCAEGDMCECGCECETCEED